MRKRIKKEETEMQLRIEKQLQLNKKFLSSAKAQNKQMKDLQEVSKSNAV